MPAVLHAEGRLRCGAPELYMGDAILCLTLAPEKMDQASVLPYRTDAAALAEWLEARARGRSAGQLRSAVDSPKTVEGTAAAAAALGFTNPTDGGLSDLGERYALAYADERRGLLREALTDYPAYREMMRGVAERGTADETDVRWIEAWWAMRGYGTSESNRREGAAAFGRLADFAGLGEYVPGRRGRPTRIRWAAGALPAGASAAPARGKASTELDAAPDLFTAAPPPLPLPASPARPPRRAASDPSRPAAASAPDPSAAPARTRSDIAVNRITVPLAGTATARIEVPLRLPAAEKRRLLDLLELLISVE